MDMSYSSMNSSAENKKKSIINTAIACVFALFFLGLIIFAGVDAAVDVHYDYVVEVDVDCCQQLHSAVTNAVEQMKSRGFEIVHLNVKKRMLSKKYTVVCKGSDKKELASN